MNEALKTIATGLGDLVGTVLVPIGATVKQFYLSVGHAQVASWTLASVILGSAFIYVAEPSSEKVQAEIDALTALKLQREAEAEEAEEKARWYKASADKLEAEGG